MLRKHQAYDRWACFACRWSAKHPRRRVGATVMSPACPSCSTKMRYCGSAFRPPPRDDVEAWAVAARLIAAGHCFRSTRRRQAYPRTFSELVAFEQQELFWAPEGKARCDSDDGQLRVWVGAHEVRDGERVLVWNRGWQPASIRFPCDGPLQRAVLVLGSRVLTVERHTRLRVQRTR